MKSFLQLLGVLVLCTFAGFVIFFLVTTLGTALQWQELTIVSYRNWMGGCACIAIFDYFWVYANKN